MKDISKLIFVTLKWLFFIETGKVESGKNPKFGFSFVYFTKMEKAILEIGLKSFIMSKLDNQMSKI